MQFGTKDLALMCIFASLYAVLSFASFFPVIGAAGKFITMATVIAPLIGLILGPWIGTASIIIGGTIGMSIAPTLSPMSFVGSVAAAMCSGLLYRSNWRVLAISYLLLLFVLLFYPTVGPVWFYPFFVWFHLVALIILVSPIQWKAAEFLHGKSSASRLTVGVAILAFLSTMLGHVAGTITFETLSGLLIIPQQPFWQSFWLSIALVYPVERLIITSIATAFGVPLIKALRTYGFKIGGK